MHIATNTGRLTYMQADGQQIDHRQAEKQTGRSIDIHIDNQISRKADRQTNRQINK